MATIYTAEVVETVIASGTSPGIIQDSEGRTIATITNRPEDYRIVVNTLSPSNRPFGDSGYEYHSGNVEIYKQGRLLSSQLADPYPYIAVDIEDFNVPTGYLVVDNNDEFLFETLQEINIPQGWLGDPSLLIGRTFIGRSGWFNIQSSISGATEILTTNEENNWVASITYPIDKSIFNNQNTTPILSRNGDGWYNPSNNELRIFNNTGE